MTRLFFLFFLCLAFLIPTVGVDAELFSLAPSDTVEGTIKTYTVRQGESLIEIARKFGGGGHFYAAGLTLDDSLERVIDMVLPGARKAIEHNKE